MQHRDFFVQMFGQDINFVFIFAVILPKLDLRQHLIGKAGRHYKTWMASSITQIQQTALRQQNHAIAVGHFDHINLVFDIGPFVVFQRGDLNFIIKMADIANDGHVFHFVHMFKTNDIFVAGGGDKNISGGNHILQQHNFIAIHRGLQGANRINLGYFNPRTSAAKAGGGAFANIAIATHNCGFACHHCVGRAANAIHQRFLTAVFIVKF